MPQPAAVVTSDLVVTLVPVTSGLKSLPDVRWFDPIYQWIGDVLVMGDSARDVVITPWSSGKPAGNPTVLQNTLPVRINFINPVLINPDTHMAPYAFDLRLHLQPQQ